MPIIRDFVGFCSDILSAWGHCKKLQSGKPVPNLRQSFQNRKGLYRPFRRLPRPKVTTSSEAASN